MFNISGMKKLAEEKLAEIEGRMTKMEEKLDEILKLLKDKKDAG